MFKVILLIALTAPSLLWGQKEDEDTSGPARAYTITDGAAMWSQTGHTFGGNANLTGVGGSGDCFWEFTWVHRIDTAGSESPFGAPTTESASGATANSTWTGLGGSGLDAHEFMQIVDDGGPSGRLRKTMTLTNTSANPITINLYAYVDADANGSPSDVTVDYTAGGGIFTFLDSTHFVQIQNVGHDNWQIGTYDNTRFGLNSAGITNLTNSGSVSFGDGTAAYQWLDRTILPGQSATFNVGIASNASLPVELEHISID